MLTLILKIIHIFQLQNYLFYLYITNVYCDTLFIIINYNQNDNIIKFNKFYKFLVNAILIMPNKNLMLMYLLMFVYVNLYVYIDVYAYMYV